MPVYSINGKTIESLAGRIDRYPIRMLRGFDVDILVTDPYLSLTTKSTLGIQTIPLDRLIRESDIISIHCLKTWEETLPFA